MARKQHRLIPLVLRGSDGFKKDFRALFALTVQQIENLVALAETEYGFDLPDDSISDATKTLGVDVERLASILRIFDFLYDHAWGGDINKEEASQQVFEFAESLAIKDCKEKISAIERLFEPKEAYDRYLTVEAASTAVVPRFSEVVSVCDIRAVTKKKTGEIIGYIPKALISIELTDTNDETKTINLQASDEDVDKLIEELNKAKKLLITLRKEFSGKILDVKRGKD